MLSTLATRRQVIEMAIANVVSLCACLSALSAEQTGDDPIEWDAFIEELAELSKSYSQSDGKERNYVKHLSQLLRSLKYSDSAIRKAIEGYQGNQTTEIVGIPVYRTLRFEIALFSFQEGQHLPYHNHPSMTGVSLCLSGSIEIHNLDVVGRADESTLWLRSSARERISSGKISWLTSHIRNIHQLRARQDSKLLDVFTPPYDPVRIAETRWYEVERQPTGKNLYAAHLL